MATTTTTDTHTPLRFVTIDVEEYYHIESAHGIVQRQQWDSYPARTDRNIDLLLDLLARHRRPATFFVLGDVARRSPAAVKRIARAGHEIASHGTMHDRLHRLNPDTFRADLLESQRRLQDLTGQPVIGYRAPTFSLGPPTRWAIDVMLDCGIRYDASIFPVRHPLYGVPTAPLTPFHLAPGPTPATGATASAVTAPNSNPPIPPRTLLEIPALVWRTLGRNVPVAGGGYFRLLPLAFMQRGLAQAARQSRPAVLYFHPWEFDPDMPRLPLKGLRRIRTYTGLRSAASRLETIVRQPARWSTLAAARDELAALADQRPRPYVL